MIPIKNCAFKLCAGLWFAFVFCEVWKFLVDLILPAYWPAYDAFIGTVGSRTLTQRLIWILLLQFFAIFIEAFALFNYFVLRRLIYRIKENSNGSSSLDSSAVEELHTTRSGADTLAPGGAHFARALDGPAHSSEVRVRQKR